MKKADWTLKEIALENYKLNLSYFKDGSYKNITQYKKLGESVRFILNNENDPINLLDIGCGTAWSGIYLKKEGLLSETSYYGCDISKEMCNMAKNNMPNSEFFILDIENSPSDKKYNVVLESAVIELVSTDWKKVLLNILKSSKKWVILHRLFYIENETKFEKVITYLNIPDMRVHINLKELESMVNEHGFKIVNKDFWEINNSYRQGTFILKKGEI